MTSSSRFTTAATAKTLVLAFLVLLFSCKGTSTPDPVTLTSLQGSWKITSVTVDPAYTYMGIPITDLTSALQLLGETCLADAVVTFNANGTISNNLSTQTTCTSATNTKNLVNTLFGTTTTYSESGNQATLVTGGQTIIGTRVFTTTTGTLVAKLPTNPAGAAIATNYTIVLTKQ